MNWKRAIYCTAVLLGTSSLVLANPPSAPQSFSVTNKTEIPGLTLKPGSYSIRVVDRLSDRVILRVDSADGSVHSTFIGLENATISHPANAGLVAWSATTGNASYVRGWYFPSLSSVVEFVYPKAEAVKIAQKTDARVPAIDPASEGRVDDKELSHDDMELVTLWLLSSTRVGPGSGTPAIQAEKYKQPASSAPQVASNEAQTGAAQVPTASVQTPTPRAQTTNRAPVQMASVHPPKPVVAVLPHTASELPLVWLLGGFSLLGGVTLRRLRRNAA